MEIIGQTAANALLPNLDSTRTVGLVTLPGAFVGVLLSTGSATQAAAVQIVVLLALLLSQTCGVAVTSELIARGMITRQHHDHWSKSKSRRGPIALFRGRFAKNPMPT